MTTARAFHWLDPRSAHQRLVLAVLLGILTWFVSPRDLSPVTRGLLAGDVAGVGLIGIVLWMMIRSDSDETCRRAAARDPGRTLVWILVVVVSGISLFAATFVLREASSIGHGEGQLLAILAIATAMLSWLLTHLGFTLRYAHLYYRDGTGHAGIELPGGEAPDDLDFAYFAFTIGMCFQVSDAQITGRTIRRTALVHALVSFAYNTGILALVLNIVITQLA